MTTTLTPSQAITTAERLGYTRGGLDEYDARETVVIDLLRNHHSLTDVSLDAAEWALNDVAEALDIRTHGDFTVYDLIISAVDAVLATRGLLPEGYDDPAVIVDPAA